MQSIDNQKFGQFITQLRKEKEMTQKQLAEQLFISDKTVSKWERGFSLPDVSLLLPLSKILNVSTTELLSGTRFEENENISLKQSNLLIEKVVSMGANNFNINKLLLQKETMKKSITKIAIFTVISITSNLLLVMFFYGILSQKITCFENEMVGPIASGITYLLIGYNFIALLLFLYLSFKKSICYLISSPIYIVSMGYLLWLINYMKQISTLNTALNLLKRGTVGYLILTAISLCAIIYGIHRHKK